MADEDPQISFRVKTSGDGLHSITMAETATVLELKAKLAGGDFENIPVERQRLIYSGRVMKNDDTLASYKIKPNNTIHLVKSAASNHTAGASAAGASASGAAATASSAAAAPAIPTNMAAGTPANNILAGLTGARFAGHAPLPNMNIFGPDGGMNLPSEEHMAEMMANPAVAASIRETLNNPSFVDFLIESNPMLRNTPNARELIQSPMFRQMMTDPDYMRMMSRMRRAMGGGGPGGAGAEAFPAPGATDTTPDGAAASPAPGAGAGAGAAGGAAANPFGGINPFLFGMPGAAGGAGAGANPFAMFGAGAGAGAGAGTTGAAGATGDAARGAAGPGAAANPLASLFGGGGGGMPQITPEIMQHMQQMFGSAVGGGDLGGIGGLGSFGGAGGFNPFGGAPAAPADTRPPEEMYADQLRQLNDMGFYDFDRNVAALRRTGGSVQGAIQHLLGD